MNQKLERVPIGYKPYLSYINRHKTVIDLPRHYRKRPKSKKSKRHRKSKPEKRTSIAKNSETLKHILDNLRYGYRG
jgi:hypothetical protein